MAVDTKTEVLDLGSEVKSTEKRDTLIKAEKKYQKFWAENAVFEANAPSLSEYPLDSISPADLRSKYPKFFGTMAYPYMNGVLHAGHSFTVSKIEFAAGVARMQGRRVLYPQGYHCTGMPIKACADKLVREIEMFGKYFEGCPDMADVNGDTDEQPQAPAQGESRDDITKFKASKSKAVAKSAGLKYQFQIMMALGIPVKEIHQFADPQHWLQFFPPLCRRDLTNFGARIDWRRQFVTTDANPFYDSFVRWQMNRLHELQKIRFGKRYTIYSPKDGQACMDHDRSEGEGVGVTEYTAMKLKVKEWSPKAQEKVAKTLPNNANVYFVPATLRPETMYGQTCCFVGPKIRYGIFQVSEHDFYFLSDRAARNMAFQSIFPAWGEFPKVLELEGSEVTGTLVNAPLSVHTQGVRILPMESVKASKGTGVVTSVPSDSPDDYATVMDLAKKADYYGIKKEWASLEIIPIIDTPKYGDLAAKYLVEQYKINSPKDATQLEIAKGEAYKEGFYNGTMKIGEFKGQRVEEAKDKVRSKLLDSGDAFAYAEPEGYVLSRSGDICVAAHLDQWYLNYGTYEKGGDGAWQEKVLAHVNNSLNTFSTEVKNQFVQTLDWLAQWACARTYGLGSKLPWDHQFLVESLSDSTIYMSYYTIAHLLHKDVFGKELGPAQIKPEQTTDDFWDYIFTGRRDVELDIPKNTLDLMSREFQYWYPLDLRVSGKDLIQNHLVFFLYIHLAIFPEEFWPRAIRVNGHLTLNGAKMSKSTGNFLTLDEAVKKFGADATRMALADAGDTLDDANFTELVANSSILRLYELRRWCEETVKKAHLIESAVDYINIRENGEIKNMDTVQRTGPKVFWDELFENELNALVIETIENYEGSMYKSALKSGFYDFTGARDSYREATKAAGIGMHRDLVLRYLELQALMLTPIAPHWAEHMWFEVLGKKTTIQNEVFPITPAVVPRLTAAREYVRSTSSSITSAEGAQQKKMAKGKAVAYDPKQDKKLTIFAAQNYPAWQEKYIEIARVQFDGMTIDVKAMSPQIGKMGEAKKAMPFLQGLKKRVDSEETKQGKERVFERKLPFKEVELLREMVPGLRQTIQKCRIVEVVSVDEGGKTGSVVAGNGGDEGTKRSVLPPPAEGAVPGSPTFFFENIGA